MVDKTKREYNIQEMVTMLTELSGNEAHVCLEKVNAMPGQGVTSQFSLGEGYGIWKGIIGSVAYDPFSKVSLTLVHPATWKKELMKGMGKEKDASVVRVLQLYPHTAHYFTKKKDHDRADALLLAEYIRRIDGT